MPDMAEETLQQKARRESATQVVICKNIAESLGAMRTFADTVRALGPRLDQAPTLVEAIENQVIILAGFTGFAGLDPSIAREIGNAVLDHTIPLSRIDEIAEPLQRYLDAERDWAVH